MTVTSQRFTLAETRPFPKVLTGESLPEWAFPAPKPLLILAHPGSGTSYACHAMRMRGLRSVQHETQTIRRGHEHFEGSTLVSYKSNPPEWPLVWGLVRDPLRTVFSIAELCKRKPTFTKAIVRQTVRGPCRSMVLERNDPLYAMMWSVYLFGKVLLPSAALVFRVEDIPMPSDQEKNRNSHYQGPVAWERLDLLCRDSQDRATLEGLKEYRRKLGYRDLGSATTDESGS